MAMKLDMDSAIKYVAEGAGAVAVPGFILGTGFATTLANIPGWATALGPVTVGGILLAAVGVGLVDQLFFSK